MDAERIEQLTGAFKNVVLALGVIVSGIWALQKFVLSENAKRQQQIEEQAANPFPIINMQEGCVLKHLDNHYLVITMNISNKSSTQIELSTERESLLSIAKVKSLSSGMMQLDAPIYGVEGNIPPRDINDFATDVSISYQSYLDLASGATGTYRYLFPLNDSGLYQITFLADHIEGRLETRDHKFLVTHFLTLDEPNQAVINDEEDQSIYNGKAVSTTLQMCSGIKH